MTQLPLAALWKRLFARILDIFVTAGIVRLTWPLMARLLAPVLAATFPPPTRDNVGTTAVAVLLLTALVLIYSMAVYALCNFAFMKRYGQTIGKRLMRIQIVNTDGTLPSVYTGIWKRELYFFCVRPLIAGLVLRFFLPRRLAWLLVGLYLVADALFIFSEEARCLHDRYAGTFVCEKLSATPAASAAGGTAAE